VSRIVAGARPQTGNRVSLGPVQLGRPRTRPKLKKDANMKKGYCTRLIISLVVAAALTAIPAKADELYARIRGTVLDSSGASVSGAQITATNEGTSIARQLVSREDGSYELISLPVGVYTVSASKNGFKKFETTGVILTVNQVYVLNIRLSPGVVTEVMRVEANPVQVETTDMQLGTVVNGQEILDLPLNSSPAWCRNRIAERTRMPRTAARLSRTAF
jgi:hypothetical protein